MSPLEDGRREVEVDALHGPAAVHEANEAGSDAASIPDAAVVCKGQWQGREVLGMRVLWFEREDGGRYIPPKRWQRQAVAMTGTHDLFTVAGWWSERDLDWTWQLGRGDPDSSEAADRENRAVERQELWSALRGSGSPGAPGPPIEGGASQGDRRCPGPAWPRPARRWCRHPAG